MKEFLVRNELRLENVNIGKLNIQRILQKSLKSYFANSTILLIVLRLHVTLIKEVFRRTKGVSEEKSAIFDKFQFAGRSRFEQYFFVKKYYFNRILNRIQHSNR